MLLHLHGRFWHEAAVRRVRNYVRFLGYSGREMLAVRLSHFDPTETLAAKIAVMHNARGAGGGREGRSSGGVAYETSEAA